MARSLYAVALLLLYYVSRCISRVKLRTARIVAPIISHLLERVRSLQAIYWPHPVVGLHGLVHTVLAPLVRSKPKGLSFDREFIVAPDGGTLCLSWVHVRGMPDLPVTAPVLFVCPGVLGDDHSWYLDQVVHAASLLKGWRAVIYVRRGCLIPMSTARSQDFSDAQKPNGDFDLAVRTIKNRFPTGPLVALGYSMGGNYIANYLGSRGEDTNGILAACCICPPFDNLAISLYMEHVNKHIDFALRRYKNVSLEMNRKVIGSDPEAKALGIDVDRLIQASSYREQCELDNYLFWRQPGETFNAYLDRSSCYHRISGIMVPTLFLAAGDDCVCYDGLTPWKEFDKNPFVVLATTQAGGHHSYVEFFSSGLSFCDRLALEWLEEALKASSDC